MVEGCVSDGFRAKAISGEAPHAAAEFDGQAWDYCRGGFLTGDGLSSLEWGDHFVRSYEMVGLAAWQLGRMSGKRRLWLLERLEMRPEFLRHVAVGRGTQTLPANQGNKCLL